MSEQRAPEQHHRNASAALREVVVPHNDRVVPVTMVRSMLLQSSLAALRQKGYLDAYLAKLEQPYHEQLLSSAGPGWSPIELACAHYRACEALGLGQSELFDLGYAVGERLESTFLVTAGKTLRGAGVTPWTVIAPLHRMGTRVFQGGSGQITKVGPKDLVIELRGTVLSQFEYFRIAFCGQPVQLSP